MDAGNVLKTYNVRGGESANLRTEEIERFVEQRGFNNFLTMPGWCGKGLRWSYNLSHFYHLYGAVDQTFLDYLYEVRPYPDYIEVETTTFCNFKCKMCEQQYWKGGKSEVRKHMSFDEFKSVLDQFPRLKWIGLTGIGQSFMNPDYPRILKLCKDRNIYIEIFDRFFFLDEKMCEFLVDIGLDKIYVSLDAASKETYKKMSLGLDWERVVGNIKTLDRVKKRKGKRFPELFFHFVMSKDNEHELEKYADFVNDLGVDVVSLQYTKVLHEFKEIEGMSIDLSDERKEAVQRHAQSLGLEATFNINTSRDRLPLSRCSVWWQPFIFVDGTVVPCCSMNEQNDRVWQRRTSLGNVFEQDFRHIWWGEKYTRMLENIRKDVVDESCSRCVLFDKSKGGCLK